MSVGRAHSAKGAVFPHLQGNNGIVAGIRRFTPPKVGLSEEFESPQVLDMNWWGRRDSNPHALRHMILNHARLPIPTLPHAQWEGISIIACGRSGA